MTAFLAAWFAERQRRTARRLAWVVGVTGLLLSLSIAGVGAVPNDLPSPGWASGIGLILPFENRSSEPNLDWMGESFVETLSDALQGSGVEVLSRGERGAMFAQEGVPANAPLSRATLIHLAGDVDARWLVTGWYAYDGRQFRTGAEVLNLERMHLTTLMPQSGSLADLQKLQSAVGWEVRQQIDPETAAKTVAPPAIALSAYENYVRGVTAPTTKLQAQYLREAVLLQPNYDRALFRLGQRSLEDRQPAAALAWLAKVSSRSPDYPQAQFLAGLAATDAGQYARAAQAFEGLAHDLPLPAVLNNLGLAEARQGKPDALDWLERAHRQAPGDVAVAGNLAAAEYRLGQPEAARELLQRTTARTAEMDELLQHLNHAAGLPVDARLVEQVEVLERDFSPSEFRAMEAVMLQFDRSRAARLEEGDQRAFHLRQAEQFLAQGALAGAEQEFRAMLQVQAAAGSEDEGGRAWLGLTRVALARRDWTAAQSNAAQAALLGSETIQAQAHVLLARVALAQGRYETAQNELTTALHLAPGLPDALTVEQQMAHAKRPPHS